jgi:hypothetical protein
MCLADFKGCFIGFYYAICMPTNVLIAGSEHTQKQNGQ